MQAANGHPGAWAVVNEDTPRIFLADNAQVISRLIALKVVAASPPSTFAPQALAEVHDHLLHERWAEAVLMWIDATGIPIDVYEEYVPVWSEGDLDRDVASMAIRVSRLFSELSEQAS